MTSYLTQQPTKKKTPQSQPIPGRERDMVRNHAGAFAFKADSWMRFERFVILGSEGGSFYVGESDLTTQNLDNVRACLDKDGLRAVKAIVEISTAGRAPKNDPALYALAMAASSSDDKVRAAALAALPLVARTGTHLFTFIQFAETMRGWGRGLRKAVSRWYLDKNPGALAYQLLKYQQRNGWSNRDIFRLSHVPMETPLGRWVMKYASAHDATRKNSKRETVRTDLYRLQEGNYTPRIVQAFELAKTASEPELVKLIAEDGLTREMIPTEKQKSPVIWDALLAKMPLTAMIRNLGRMSACGLLAPFSNASSLVVSRLQDTEYLHRSRVHPMQVLAAMLTYGQGHGDKGKLTWNTVPQVRDALNEAFYAAFLNVQPTLKRFCIGIDVSGSMASGVVAGMPGLTPNMGAAAMAMLIARTEANYFIGGFSHRFVDLAISRSDRLDTAMRKCQRDFGGTDTAVAIEHAIANRFPVDAFVIATDGETWAGNIHTSQALDSYRQKMGIPAKLIVINMVPNHTTITDPQDPGSLDVVGFDAGVPGVIAQFIGSNSNGRTEPDDASE